MYSDNLYPPIEPDRTPVSQPNNEMNLEFDEEEKAVEFLDRATRTGSGHPFSGRVTDVFGRPVHGGKLRIEGSWLMGTIFNHAFGSTKLNRPQEELNQGVQIAVCNSLATTPKESAIRKKKDRESRRLRRADSTEKEKMMERISNSQSKLETRLSETQERADERRASLQSNAKAKRASETKEQRTERFTYHSTRYRNKKDEKNSNIRQFNSALALASMGAQVEEFRDYGLYSYKIHEQIYRAAGPLHPSTVKALSYGQLYTMDTKQAAEARRRELS
uniref:Uncharacterized protein n=1 Tax=Caenorhabditis japonica TaxID=281687 RepID=A0A8R1EQD3_CAEJA